MPPPPEYVAALLTDLCEAINDDLLPPLVQAALVHAQFETIHPFDDGNGRTGRALIHVVLRRRGIAPAWAIIDILPAHPMISAPVAAAATGRSKPQIYQGLRELEKAGILEPLSLGKRNRSWEAVGLLDLLARLEAGERP